MAMIHDATLLHMKLQMYGSQLLGNEVERQGKANKSTLHPGQLFLFNFSNTNKTEESVVIGSVLFSCDKIDR